LPEWTPWGSYWATGLFHHTRCPECQYRYNGRTGKANLVPAIICIAIPALLTAAILVGLFFVLRRRGGFRNRAAGSSRSPEIPCVRKEHAMSERDHNRRDFLQTTLAGAAALGLTAAGGAAEGGGTGLPQRPLGKTGVEVPILCLGGWHIGSVKSEAEAVKIMHAAIDEGLTFFDNAWDYHDGGSEVVMGKALATGGKRNKVFLMTKNCNRDGKGTLQCLEDSLRRLRTDHLDLWQFHEINYDNDPDWVLEKGGLAAALKARQQGKVRFLGFTGHKSPDIHLKMLAKHDWDTVQMPINVCDYFYRSFAHQVVPAAVKKGIAPIGMKSLGGGRDHKGRLVAEKVCTAQEARAFALSQPIASLVVGIDSMKVLRQDLATARQFKPLGKEALQKLLARVRPVAGDGRHERFKSTQFFDGLYHQKQHGLTKEQVEG
jgi:aryl-alcohol dehydrogenase-like predicted oxidoreductase